VTPVVGRAARGALAGVVGTLAMDVLWWSRYRRGGGRDGFADWELATGTTSFDDAPAPGRVGQRVAQLAGFDLPDERAAATTNVVHWLTGVGYGAAHGVLHDRRRSLVGGMLTGLTAFVSSYATLGPLGVYEPIWEYDGRTLAQDLSAHLVFGVVTGAAYAASASGRRQVRAEPMPSSAARPRALRGV
jgi:hypothetical protein